MSNRLEKLKVKKVQTLLAWRKELKAVQFYIDKANAEEKREEYDDALIDLQYAQDRSIYATRLERKHDRLDRKITKLESKIKEKN